MFNEYYGLWNREIPSYDVIFELKSFELLKNKSIYYVITFCLRNTIALNCSLVTDSCIFFQMTSNRKF